MARLDQILSAGSTAQKDKASGQMGLFGDDFDFGGPPAAAATDDTSAPKVEPWDLQTVLTFEKELLGFYVSGHPLDPWWGVIQKGKFIPLGEADDRKDELVGKRHKFGCFVNSVTVKYTKAGKQFAVAIVEDFTGTKEMIFWSETWEKNKEFVVANTAVEISAKVEADNRGDGIQLMANSVSPLPEPKPGDLPKRPTRKVISKRKQVEEVPAAAAPVVAPPKQENLLLLKLSAKDDGIDDLYTIAAHLKESPGDVPVRLLVTRYSGETVEIQAGKNFAVERSEELLESLAPWL
jgi:DNA polymerase III subunit alpha